MEAFQTLLGLASSAHGPTTYDMLYRSESTDKQGRGFEDRHVEELRLHVVWSTPFRLSRRPSRPVL